MIAKKFPIRLALIDGEWVASPKTFAVTDPATGAEIAAVPDLGADDATRAIDAAATAFPAWSAKTAKERAAILRRWFDLVTAETESLAQLMTMEQGKPLAESRAEVAYGAAFIEWFARRGKACLRPHHPDHRYLQALSDHQAADRRRRRDHAVEFPDCDDHAQSRARARLRLHDRGEAGGRDPLCALALAKLAQNAGLPKGVFNVVTTRTRRRRQGVLRRCARAQVLLHRLDRGRQAARRQCAGTVKSSRSNSAATRRSSFSTTPISTRPSPAPWPPNIRNAGQTCVCANRILVQSGIYDRSPRSCGRRRRSSVGPGRSRHADRPLINDEAIEKVETLVGDAVKKGAKALTGGELDGRRAILHATVVADVTPEMERRPRGDFRPGGAADPLRHRRRSGRPRQRHAVRPRRLFLHPEVSRAWRVAESRRRHGRINDGIFSNEVMPFGGVKESASAARAPPKARRNIRGQIYLFGSYRCLIGLVQRRLPTRMGWRARRSSGHTRRPTRYHRGQITKSHRLNSQTNRESEYDRRACKIFQHPDRAARS